MKAIKSIFIEDFDLSVRTFNNLKRAGFNNMDDILKVQSKDDFFKIRNFDLKCVDELVDIVHDMGLMFKWEPRYSEEQNFIVSQRLGGDPLVVKARIELRKHRINCLNFNDSIKNWCEKHSINKIDDLLTLSIVDLEDISEENKSFLIDVVHSFGLKFNYEIIDNLINQNNEKLIELQIKNLKQENDKKKELIKKYKELILEGQTLNEEIKKIIENIVELQTNNYEKESKPEEKVLKIYFN